MNSTKAWIVYDGDYPLTDEYGAFMMFPDKNKAEEYIKDEKYTIEEITCSK